MGPDDLQPSARHLLGADTALQFHMIDSVDRMITQLKSSKYDSITIFYDNDYAYKITWRDGENFTATTIPYA